MSDNKTHADAALTRVLVHLIESMRLRINAIDHAGVVDCAVVLTFTNKELVEIVETTFTGRVGEIRLKLSRS